MMKILVILFAFMSNMAYAWIVTADFDSLVNGATCEPFWKNSEFDTEVDNAHVASGSNSCRFGVSASDVNLGAGFAFNNSGASYIGAGVNCGSDSAYIWNPDTTTYQALMAIY